jgi:hypothetical protein
LLALWPAARTQALCYWLNHATGLRLARAAAVIANIDCGAGGELSNDHAPEALKPLLQPDSALAKLYEVCDTCEALSNTAAAANQVGNPIERVRHALVNARDVRRF